MSEVIILISIALQTSLLVHGIRWRRESRRMLASIQREYDLDMQYHSGVRARVAFRREDRGEA